MIMGMTIRENFPEPDHGHGGSRGP